MSFDDNVCKKIVIKGRVQGVGFRAAAQREVERIGKRLGPVAGYVRNCPDGTVEILAQGDSEAVEALVDWAREGPSSAAVDGLDVQDAETEGRLRGFEIRK